MQRRCLPAQVASHSAYVLETDGTAPALKTKKAEKFVAPLVVQAIRT